jgi:hypothetical protein
VLSESSREGVLVSGVRLPRACRRVKKSSRQRPTVAVGVSTRKLRIIWSSGRSLRKPGDPAHGSVLWRKAREVSGWDEKWVGERLLKCAVTPGEVHDERGFPADPPPDHPALTDEELGVARCRGHSDSTGSKTHWTERMRRLAGGKVLRVGRGKAWREIC